MRKYLKNSIAFLLVVIMLVTSYLPTFAVGEPSTYSKSSNSGERDEVCTTLDGTSADSYYSGSYTYANLTAQTTEQLFTSLRTLMRSTHKYTSSYNDCKTMADKTDCENNDGKVSLIYTGYSATMSQWNGWNREHIWPQSLGGDNTNGGGADLHHIRPSDAVVNSTRGNKKYGNVSGGSEVYGNNPAKGYLGGTSGTYFEPNDNVKGDVARICLYVYVRWGSDWGADSITKVFQSVDVLLEWCALDPVDTWEMGRNEVVQSIQGNRNVFIDYPELAWLIFGKEAPSNMTTPSGEATNGSGSTGGNQGGTTDPDQGGNTGDGNQGGNTGGSTTPTDPAEILDAAYALGVGETMTGPFTLTGVITALDKYNNPTMVVGNHTDKPIYCYYLADDRFVVGATITVTAERIKNYEGTVEMMNCTLDSITLPDDSGNQGGETGGNTGGNTGGETGGNGGNQGGTTTPECTHTNTELKNVKAATCKAEGYSGDTYCKDCGKLLSSGQTTKFDGDHSYGAWELTSDGETHSRHCTVCGKEEIMTIETLISTIDSDAEKILILLTLGITDVELLDALSK